MSWNVKCIPHCSKHQFQLIPTDPKIKDKDSIFAQFCSYSSERSMNGWPYQYHFADLPVYNNDNNYASAAFILQSERQKYDKDLQISLQKEWSIIASQYCQKSIDFLAEPRLKNNFCSVCKVYYQDYFKHIKRNQHNFQARKSPFNRDIQSLTSLMSKKRAKSTSRYQQIDLQAIDSTLCCSLDNESDQVEIIQNPRKKIKCNEMREIKVQEKLIPLSFKTIELEVDAAKEFVRIFRGQQRSHSIQNESQHYKTINKYSQHRKNIHQKLSKNCQQKEMIAQYIIIDD